MLLTFDPKVVRLSAVKKAAYRLSDVVTAEISLSEGGITCRLVPVPGSEESEERLEHLFRTAALDQELREQIADETAPLRNAILALAFSPIVSSKEAH